MYMKSMSWISVIALAPAVFLISSANYTIALEFIICWASASIVVLALRAGKYEWAGAFLVMAVAFNPIVPISISGVHFRWMEVACMGGFLASLFYFRTVLRPGNFHGSLKACPRPRGSVTDTTDTPRPLADQ